MMRLALSNKVKDCFARNGCRQSVMVEREQTGESTAGVVERGHRKDGDAAHRPFAVNEASSARSTGGAVHFERVPAIVAVDIVSPSLSAPSQCRDDNTLVEG
jgi:hypothetical protein